MKNDCPRELRQRLVFAVTGQRSLWPTTALEQLRIERWLAVFFACLACIAIALSTYALLSKPIPPAIATRSLLTFNAFVLQALFLCRVAAAFIPPASMRRRSQLYVPIGYTSFLRNWFSSHRTANKSAAGIMLIVGCGAWLCKVPLVHVATNLLWQFAVLAWLNQSSYEAMGRCGKLRRSLTFLFWVYAIISIFCLHIAVFLNDPVASAIILGPVFVMVVVPDVALLAVNPYLVLLIAISAFTIAYRPFFTNRDWLSPSCMQMRRISRCWRRLPDCERPQVGELSYPTEVKSTRQRNKQLGQLLYDEQTPFVTTSNVILNAIRPASPQMLIDQTMWRKVRWYGFLCGAPQVIVVSIVAVLNALNHLDSTPAFAVTAIMFHLPAMFGMLKLLPLVRCGLVGSRELLCIGLRGAIRDTLLAILFFAPFLWLHGQLRNDFSLPSIHLANCLATAVMVRMVWSAILGIHSNAISFAVAFYAIPLMFVLGSVVFANSMVSFGVIDVSIAGAIAAAVGMAIILIRWDRVAAMIHPHVPKLQWIWQFIAVVRLRFQALGRTRA